MKRRTVVIAFIASVASFLALSAPVAGAAPLTELTEFPVPFEAASPFAITTGPDGALWFTQRANDSIRRLSADGTFAPSTALAMGADPTAITAGPDDAVWFTEQGSGMIGRLGMDGALSEFLLPTDGAGPAGIVSGPDGALWFTERSAHRVGRMDTDGTAVEFTLPTALAGPMGITVGSDGNLWFAEQRANKIGRITPGGVVTEFPIPVASSLPTGMATGPDGAVWFTMRAANRIGRIDMAGTVSTFAVPTAATDPTGITLGWDGALWFTEPDVDAVGRITTEGEITEFPLPTVGSSPFGITDGPDGAVWFAEGNGNRIGRLTVHPEPPADTIAPTISITSPADGGVFVAGRPVPAAYSCVDEAGGSGIAACTGSVPAGQPIDMTPGSHRFQVSAADVAGNTASASSGYLVFSKIGGSLASTAIQRAGTWATLDLGFGSARLPRDVSLLVAAGYPQSRQVSCSDPSITLGPSSPVTSHLHANKGELGMRWRTERAWAGTCRALVLRFVAPGWTTTDAVFVARF